MARRRTLVDEAVQSYSSMQHLEDRLERAHKKNERLVTGLTPEEFQEYVTRTTADDKRRNEYQEAAERIAQENKERSQ